jgi:hypothetical protein
MQDMYLDALLVPQLFDGMLRRLASSQPSSPAAVLRALQADLTVVEAEYFKSVVIRFQQLVADIPINGFPSYCSQLGPISFCSNSKLLRGDYLTFAVPQLDGTVFDFFPGGSRMVVSPTSWESFEAMYAWYTSAGSPSSLSVAPVRLWPLQQRLHLSSDYNIVLKAISFIGSSSTLDISDEDWDAHFVTYTVPFGGVLFETRAGGRGLTVGKRQIREFVAEASLKLTQLELSSSSKGKGSLTPLPPPSRPPQNNQLLCIAKIHAFPLLIEGLGKLNTPLGDSFSGQDFAKLGICFCVPVHGKVIDLLPGGSATPVTLGDIPKFVHAARTKLGLIPLGGTVSIRQELSKIGVSEPTGALSPSALTFPVNSGSPVRGRRENVDPDLSPMNNLLRQTVNYLTQGRLDSAEIDSLELTFVAYADKEKVLLIEKGDETHVTSSNVSEFLRLVQKLWKSPLENQVTTPPLHLTSESSFWELVGLLEGGHVPVDFDNLGYRFALHFPNGRTLLLKENGNACAVTRANLDEFVNLVKQKRELIHLSFVHSSGASRTAVQPPPSAEDEQGQKFDPAKWDCALSGSWNAMPLRESSLLSPVFSLVLGLSGADTVFTDDDMDRMHLSYCIPLPNGDKYDLVPNGRNIPVTKELRQDYVKRVNFERLRIESKRQQRRADAARGAAASNSMNRSIGTVPLTTKQVQILAQMKLKFEALQGMPNVTEEQWTQLGLSYCIWCEEVAFDLIPEGRKIPVKFSNRQSYITMTIAKIQEILQDQEDRRSIVVPPASREQRELYSPQHFSSNLFSPLQLVTTRHIPQAQLINEVLLAASSSAGEAEPAHLSGSLADFLSRHALGPLLPQLESSGVTTLSELCELRESDLHFISNVVSRRRLIEAAKLKK